MAFNITMSNDYSFREGGGGDFEYEGFFPYTIAEVTEGQSRSGNMTLKITFVCQHPQLEGKKVVRSIPVTGVNNRGGENVQQLMDLLVSAYTAQGKTLKEADAECSKLKGQSLSSDSVIQTITGMTVFAETVARVWTDSDGNERIGGEIKNFISRDKLERLKAADADVRPLPEALQQVIAARKSGGDNTAVSASTGGTQPALTQAAESVV